MENYFKLIDELNKQQKTILLKIVADKVGQEGIAQSEEALLQITSPEPDIEGKFLKILIFNQDEIGTYLRKTLIQNRDYHADQRLGGSTRDVVASILPFIMILVPFLKVKIQYIDKKLSIDAELTSIFPIVESLFSIQQKNGVTGSTISAGGNVHIGDITTILSLKDLFDRSLKKYEDKDEEKYAEILTLMDSLEELALQEGQISKVELEKFTNDLKNIIS